MAFPYHPKPVNPKWDGDEPRSGRDQGTCGPHGSGVPVGSGTEVSGYVESPVEKRCGTCEYLEGGKFCNQETVLKDPEVPDGSNGLKMVNPKDGCCSFWEAGNRPSRGQQNDLVNRPKTKPSLPKMERAQEDEKSPRLRLTFY